MMFNSIIHIILIIFTINKVENIRLLKLVIFSRLLKLDQSLFKGEKRLIYILPKMPKHHGNLYKGNSNSKD